MSSFLCKKERGYLLAFKILVEDTIHLDIRENKNSRYIPPIL
jgi:hypothetical protein